MGIFLCVDKHSPTDENRNFQFDKSQPTQDVSAHSRPSLVGKHGLSDEEKDVLTNPHTMQKKVPAEDVNTTAMSYHVGMEVGGKKTRPRQTSEPGLRIAYSSSAFLAEQTILIDEALLEALTTSVQVAGSTTRKFSLSRRTSKPVQKKKAQLNEITINGVMSKDVGANNVKPEIYKLIILLREVWAKLDVDMDNYLNMSELKSFCKEVWEEPVIDGGASKIMTSHAKADPEKGINFNEWCLLIKDEDPDLQDFVEEIYEIFVDPRSDTETEIEP